MSFYGTVYYQLVDTFNKVAMRNSSIEEKSFPSSVVTSDQQINAIGRDAKLNIEGGNRWINFTKDTENNCFKVWHATPDTTSSSWIEGYQKLDSAPAGAEVVELNPGDYFKTFSTKYDAAGHIVPSSLETKYYKMPKSEVEEELDILKELVGEKADGDEEATGLCKEIADNTANIATNTADLTLLKDVYGGDATETAYALFSSPWITGGEEGNSFKNFPQYFGKMDSLIDACNTAANSFSAQNLLTSTEYNPSIPLSSVSESVRILATMLQKLKLYCDTQDNEAEAAAAAAGTAVEALGTLHSQTSANLGTLTAKHNAYETATNGEIANIKTDLARVEAEYKAADGALSARIDEVNGVLTPLNTAYGTYVSQNDENILKINQEQGAIKEIIGENKEAESTGLYKIIYDGDAAVSSSLTTFTNTQTGINNDYNSRISENTTQIGALNDKIGSKTVDDNGVYSEVSGVYIDIKTLDDKITGVNSTVEALKPDVTSLKTAIGSPAIVEGEGLSPSEATGLYKNIYDINSEISSLKTVIGNETDSTGLFNLITNMQQEIASLKSRIETLEAAAPEDPEPTEPDPGEEPETEGVDEPEEGTEASEN